MSEEGKITRARAKAGGGERLSPGMAPKGSSFTQPAVPLEEPSFDRVTGRCGPPLSTVAMHHESHGGVANSFRRLRNRLLDVKVKGAPPHVITFSSGTRREGKTTVVFNLAVAFAELEAGRVVVVDGDTCGPAIHNIANISAVSGLGDVLKNGLDLNGNVYATTLPNLDVIPAHPDVSVNGSERLIHLHCKALLAKLRKYYKFVLVDTPPILMGVSPAAVFGKNSDGVVLVARLEKTPREVVKKAAEEMNAHGVTILGCVLTHREHHVPDLIYRRLSGGSSGYYYGYGTGYGYGHGRKKGKSRRRAKRERSEESQSSNTDHAGN